MTRRGSASRGTRKEQAGFASELTAIRRRFDLSESAAANLLGVPSSAVARIEQGIMVPSAETVRPEDSSNPRRRKGPVPLRNWKQYWPGWAR